MYAADEALAAGWAGDDLSCDAVVCARHPENVPAPSRKTIIKRRRGNQRGQFIRYDIIKGRNRCLIIEVNANQTREDADKKFQLPESPRFPKIGRLLKKI